MKKVTEITVETRRRLLVISRGQKKIMRAWCAPCATNLYMLTAEDAARLSGFSLRQLFRHIEGGQLHFAETRRGSLLCLDSLCALMPQTEEPPSKFSV